MFFENIDTIMVDVRSHDEYNMNTLTGAISVPLVNIHDTLDYIVFCDNGKRSQEAFIIFKKHGFKVFNGGSLI